MQAPRYVTTAALVLGLLATSQSNIYAQVVEQRESQANPSVAIFRATLFGAGTGLLLGGAYALVEDTDTDTDDILKWGVAGGAAAGAVVGLLYVALRAGPEGDAESVGMLELKDGDLDLSFPSLYKNRIQDAGGGRRKVLETRLFQARF